MTRAASVATLDEQNACKTSSRDVPQLKRVPSRKIHERLYVWLRQDEIADQKCDGAGRLKQGNDQRHRAQGDGMPRRELIFLHSTNGGGCFRWRDEDSTYLQSEHGRSAP